MRQELDRFHAPGNDVLGLEHLSGGAGSDHPDEPVVPDRSANFAAQRSSLAVRQLFPDQEPDRQQYESEHRSGAIEQQPVGRTLLLFGSPALLRGYARNSQGIGKLSAAG